MAHEKAEVSFLSNIKIMCAYAAQGQRGDVNNEQLYGSHCLVRRNLGLNAGIALEVG